MPELGLGIAAAAVFAYALIARRLSAWIVTPPLVFLCVGYVLEVTELHHSEVATDTLHLLAEATLVIVLFSDAAMIDLGALRRDHTWPGRMLLIGLPLAILIGTAVVSALIPGWTIWEAALLAAILAPTDAALGQAVITNPVVPERVRRALAVESGLNDGLALPLILFFAFAAVGGRYENAQDTWLVFAAEQVVVGTLAGCLVGFGGGWLLRFAAARGLSSEEFEGVGVLALAGLSYFASVAAGGNGFVAAFVGGLCFGRMLAGRCRFVFEFMETEGQVLVLLTFLLIGAALLPKALDVITLPEIIVILASLFVVRPAAIWVSLIGTDTAPLTKIFLGWFGPRGLATALFALVIVGEIDTLARGPEILAICVVAVMLSTIAHGVTAAPAARWYGRHLEAAKPRAEHVPISGTARPIRTRSA